MIKRRSAFSMSKMTETGAPAESVPTKNPAENPTQQPKLSKSKSELISWGSYFLADTSYIPVQN